MASAGVMPRRRNEIAASKDRASFDRFVARDLLFTLLLERTNAGDILQQLAEKVGAAKTPPAEVT